MVGPFETVLLKVVQVEDAVLFADSDVELEKMTVLKDGLDVIVELCAFVELEAGTEVEVTTALVVAIELEV